LHRPGKQFWVGVTALAALLAVACGHDVGRPDAAPATAASAPAAATQAAIATADAPPPASETGGFDASKAYEFTAKVVGFGPRPRESDALHNTQD